MRQIKFRGHFPGDTKNFYGDLIQRDGYTYIRQGNGTIQVDPDSVAQLAYVDADGREYYEGDELKRNGRTWRVELCMRWNET